MFLCFFSQKKKSISGEFRVKLIRAGIVHFFKNKKSKGNAYSGLKNIQQFSILVPWLSHCYCTKCSEIESTQQAYLIVDINNIQQHYYISYHQRKFISRELSYLIVFNPSINIKIQCFSKYFHNYANGWSVANGCFRKLRNF